VNPRSDNLAYAYDLDAYKRHRIDLILEKPSFRGLLARDKMLTCIYYILYISVMTNEYCGTRRVIDEYVYSPLAEHTKNKYKSRYKKYTICK